MRILITGGSGFIGRHLVKRLLEQGDEVHLLARAHTDLEEWNQCTKAMSVYRHDGGTESLCQYVKSLRPDLVVHLASYFLAQHTAADIQQLISSNLLFGTQLAEAMALAEVKWLVNTGTSWQHYENADYRPVCLYAATKQAFECILQFYIDVGKLNVINLKLHDTFGPDDRRGKIIPFLMKRATQKENCENALNMSPGEQLIDIVYIDDVVDAYLLAIQRLQTGCVREETYSVSSGNPTRLRDLVAEFEIAANKSLNISWGGRPYREREVMRPWSVGQPIPGWVPRIGFQEGVKRIIANDI